MVSHLLSSRRSTRLRSIGWIVLGAGFVSAVLMFWVKRRDQGPPLDDLIALGYRRSLEHQTGVMMGRFGMMLSDWQETLTSPLGQAVIVLMCAALLAGYFFRVAWVADHEDDASSAGHRL